MFQNRIISLLVVQPLNQTTQTAWGTALSLIDLKGRVQIIKMEIVESLYCSEASYIPASAPGLAAAQFTYWALTLPLTTFLGWFSQIPCLVGYFQIPWEVTSPSHPLFLPRAVFEWNQRSHRTYNVRTVRRNPLTNYLCLCFIWQHKCTALPDIFL